MLSTGPTRKDKNDNKQNKTKKHKKQECCISEQRGMRAEGKSAKVNREIMIITSSLTLWCI